MLDHLFQLSGFPLIEDSFTERALRISSKSSVTPELFHSQKLLRSRVNLIFLVSHAKSPRHFAGPGKVFLMPLSILASAHRIRHFTPLVPLSTLTWIPNAN